MERQVQQTGVRKWYGEDWIKMQDEIFKSIEQGVLANLPNCILVGCQVQLNFINGIYTLQEGYALIDGKICYVPQTVNVPATVYLTQKVETIATRAYADQVVKPIQELYTVEVNTATTGSSELVLSFMGITDNVLLRPHLNNGNLSGLPKSDNYSNNSTNTLATSKAVSDLRVYLLGFINGNAANITTLFATTATHTNQIGAINQELYGGGFSSF